MYGNVQQQVLPQKRVNVHDRCFRDGQKWIRILTRWELEQVIEMNGEGLFVRLEAAHTVDAHARMQSPLDIHPLMGSSKAQNTVERCHIQILSDAQPLVIKIKIAAEADVLVEQETDV